MKSRDPIILADSSATGGLPSWLQVKAEGSGRVELLIVGQIGKSFWDDSGVDEKAFRDQLAAIPEGAEIVVGINSQGGNVQAGLGIYNALAARKGKVTTRNDGYAASIASVILCAGSTVICPETAAVMIHDPWTMVSGNSDDMERAKRMLEANAEVMVSAYAKRTGKKPEEIRAAMKAETWFTGKSAKEWGLVDEVTSAKADLQTLASAFDPARHTGAPRHVVEVWNSSGRRPASSNETKEELMNKTGILALLKKHGVNIAADATEASILAALTKLVDDGKVSAAEREKLTKPEPAQGAAPAQVNTGNPAPANSAQDPAIVARLTTLEAENANLRRREIQREVDALVEQGRIPAAQADDWERRAQADASILEMARALPARLPGAAPVADIEITQASLPDMARHLGRLCTEATASMLRGNDVGSRVIAANSLQAGQFYDQNRTRLLQVLGAVTVPTDLQRNVILQEIMTAFARRLLPIRAFSTVFQNVPLEGTNIVSVPYFPLVTAASTDWNASNGYVMGDGTQQAKTVTVNKRKYQPLSVSSSELSRQPAINLGRLAAQNADKLGYDVFSDVLSVVVSATYGAASFTGAASTFDSSDIADLKGVADVANWPDMGRALIIKSAYDVNVLKDSGVKAAYAFGSAEPIRLGRVPSILGFDYFVCENIPANGQNLVGMISVPSGILFASAPVMPADEVRGQLANYQVITHPETGITLEYRRWGNADFDQRREVIECNYGYAAGETAAIKRLVSA